MDKREMICMAGLRLIDEGLAARTWGNISMRLDENRFLITPGGRPYETIRPDEIVSVNTGDFSWSGNVRPSSELALHGLVYRNRPDVKVIIHTHQTNGSVTASMDMSVLKKKNMPEFPVPCSERAFPGTQALAENTVRALGTGKTVLLANHGAVCTGTDIDSAFEAALDLERKSLDWLDEISPEYSMLRRSPAPESVLLSGETEFYALKDPLKQIYETRPDIHAVIYSVSPWIRAACCSRKKKIFPLLDDAAQIIGQDLPVYSPAAAVPEQVFCTRRAVPDRKSITGPWPGESLYRFLKKTQFRNCIKGRDAVLINGMGALCFGSDPAGARQVLQVLDKACRCFAETEILGCGMYIKKKEAVAMRKFYTETYSREASENVQNIPDRLE